MAARTLVIALVVGCGGAPVVEPPELPIAPRPHAGYTIQAADLGDANILAKIPHHARLHRYLDASLEETGPTFSTTPRPIRRPPMVQRGGRRPLVVPSRGRDNNLSRDATADPAHPDETELPWRETVPVLGATPARLRVVSDQDDARLAVWIDRADAAPVIVAQTQLVDDAGHPIAVWLEPGVDLAVAGHAGAFTAAIVRVDGLQLAGRIRDDAIGDVWIGPDPRLVKTGVKTIDPARLPGRAQLRAAPRADAPVLAETIDDLGVTILGAHGDWRELELRHQGVRVRGFVPASSLDPTDTGGFGVSGFGSGNGYGISDTDRFEVTAGTCLYEREGGQVIGVNTKTRERYGHRGAHDEWPAVYIGTPWGLVLVRAHVVAAGWESCLP